MPDTDTVAAIREKRQAASASAKLAAQAAQVAADLQAADQDVKKHLGASRVAAQKALAIMAGMRKSMTPATQRRTLGMMAQVKGALSLLEGVGSMQPRWDTSDPDLTPENQKTVPVRAKAKPTPPARGDS